MEKFGRRSANYIPVNRMMVDWKGPVWLAAGCHEDEMSAWKREHNIPHYLVSCRKLEGVNRTLPAIDDWAGTSSLYAVRIALELGHARKVILCGVPMDTSGKYNGEPDDLALYMSTYRAAWLRAVPRLRGLVKSYSGWTRELLGEPSREWLDGTDGCTEGELQALYGVSSSRR